ncbi:molybdopterin-dependent oxidoreductase [Marinobacterium arenosum]|uniref:molybdopterin-dependent oxidoreductase n=1 Tax=Marinobacterium arenosum TaxID=2862496 RepID=UPI001C93FB10|nr:molybdopterin-dependent oxidoreductase [Marinobacterium arenosum]MBY4677717.1 hypothetical protein [Marinobacterium arenosum]
MLKKLLLKLLFLTMASLAPWAAADSLPKPAGKVILTIEGAIKNTNSGDKAVFDRAMLENLGMVTTRTHTPWTDGVTEFEGPLGRSLLEVVGAEGENLTVTALNDYSANVPSEDFYSFDVILALKMDGAYMRVRNKGPLFVIYPFDRSPELNTEVIHNRSVWQVKSIRVD